MPITNPPRVPFGPKTYSARDTFAKKLNSVRSQYVAGANRRNMAAIRSGIKARSAAAGPAPTAIVPSGTVGVPAPTEALVQALTALNETLLECACDAKDAAFNDSEYKDCLKKALGAKEAQEKCDCHQIAAKRASALGSTERAERHERIAVAQASLIAKH